MSCAGMAQGVWGWGYHRSVHLEGSVQRGSLSAHFPRYKGKACHHRFRSKAFSKCMFLNDLCELRSHAMNFLNFLCWCWISNLNHETTLCWNLWHLWEKVEDPPLPISLTFGFCLPFHGWQDQKLLDSKKLCVYLIEKSLSQLPPGGETFLGIFDLRGFQQKNGDLKFVKFLVSDDEPFFRVLYLCLSTSDTLPKHFFISGQQSDYFDLPTCDDAQIDVFFNYYPKRLGQVLFVDAPFIFQPGWNMVKPLVGKYAALVSNSQSSSFLFCTQQNSCLDMPHFDPLCHCIASHGSSQNDDFAI